MAFNQDRSSVNPLFAAATIIEAALNTAGHIRQAQQFDLFDRQGGSPGGNRLSPWASNQSNHGRGFRSGNRRVGEDRSRNRGGKKGPSTKKGGPKRSESGQNSSKESQDEGSYADADPALLKCTECNVKARDSEFFERHLKGSQHQRVMEILKQQHAKMLEVIRLKAKMETTILEMQVSKLKSANKPPTVHCNMCQLDVCGPMSKHRLIKSHQELKAFLHPHCDVCDKSFQLRSDWDSHKYSKSHLIKMSEKSGFRIDDDYVSAACRPVVVPVQAVAVAAPEKKVDQEMEKMKKREDEELSEERIRDYVVPDESKGKLLGVSMVKPVNGFFCCACKKFFASKLSDHCESSNHYSKFVECVESKKQKLGKRKLEETDFSMERGDNEDNNGKVQKLPDE